MASKLIERKQKQEVLQRLRIIPAVALLGPRQAGKTTLALSIVREMNGFYIDCSDRKTNANIQERGIRAYADRHAGKLIVIDGIQRQQDLFTDLRGIIDERRRQGLGSGCFLLLGAADTKISNKSTETLYGRIAKVFLDPIDVLEAASDDRKEIEKLWLRGGFPASFTAGNEAASFKVREQIVDFLIDEEAAREGMRIDAAKIHRLCVFLAHSQGQTINFSSIAMQLDMDRRAVRSLTDLFCNLLAARMLVPFHRKIGKRLVKTPKFYYRDSGLLHQLLEIDSADVLDRHPVQGASWEGFVIENIIRQMRNQRIASYYRTQDGAEIDMVIESPQTGLWAIEIKRGIHQVPSKGFHIACRDLQPDRIFVVHDNAQSYTSRQGIEFLTLPDICREVAAKFRLEGEEPNEAE